jgi:hypothetical protein
MKNARNQEDGKLDDLLDELIVKTDAMECLLKEALESKWA